GRLELAFLVDVAPRQLPGRNRIAAGEARQTIDRRDIVHRWQVQDALLCADHVERGLGQCIQTEDTAPAEPERRRHRGEVGRAVLVFTADQHDRRAEIQDGWLADDMWGIHVSVSPLWRRETDRRAADRNSVFCLEIEKAGRGTAARLHVALLRLSSICLAGGKL